MGLITSIELKLDNTNYTSVPFNDPLTISRRLGEELDTGGFNVWLNQESPITPFTECKITDSDSNISYWYSSSTSEQVTFVGTPQYEHKVGLIEPTKRLERLYVGAKTFSNPLDGTPKTILEIIEILRDVTPLRRGGLVVGGTDRPFEIDATIEDRLDAIDAREFSFSPDKMMLEILAEIGEYIGAYPRLIDFETLTFDFYSDLVDEVEDGDYSAKLETLLESQYHNNLVSNLQNTLPETISNASSIQSIWSTPRNDNGERISTTAGMYLLVDNPIYGKLPKLYVTNFGWQYGLVAPFIRGSVTYTDTLDLSDYLIEKREYDTLNGDDDGKGSFLYYNQDNNKIDGLLYENPVILFISIYTIERIIALKLFGSVPLGFTLTTPFEDIPYQIEYSPTTSILTKKTKITPNNQQLDLMYNQSENITDAISFGEALINKSARLGVKTYENVYSFEELTGIKQIGTFNSDNYFADGYDLYYWNGFIEQKVTYSNDYIKLEEFVGIDSLNRFSNVPQTGDIVERKLHFNEYCIISDDEYDDTYETHNITDTGLERIGAVFNPIAVRTTDDEQTSFAILRTQNELIVEEQYLIVNVSSIGFGDTLHFNFKMEDNYSAGQTTVLDGSNRYSQGQEYSGSDGDIKYLSMGMFSKTGLPANSTDLQAVAYEYPGYNISTYTPSVDPDIDFNYGFLEPTELLQIEKDARETINYNHQIQFMPDDKKFVLGAGFTENNTLVANTATTELFIWLLDYKVGKFNRKKIDTTQATKYTHADFTSSHIKASGKKNGVLRINREGTSTGIQIPHDAWALGDADGNLYLAVNETLITIVSGLVAIKYFNYRNKL
jgi:hypothetical protein